MDDFYHSSDARPEVASIQKEIAWDRVRGVAILAERVGAAWSQHIGGRARLTARSPPLAAGPAAVAMRFDSGRYRLRARPPMG
jgi:hypothetical protein